MEIRPTKHSGDPFTDMTELPIRGLYETENKLLVECSQRRLDAGQIAHISDTIKGASLNWGYLLAVAKKNALYPLVGHNLIEHFAHLLPADVVDTMEPHLQEHLQRNMFLTAKLLEIVRTFDAKGIPILPFKGPLLAAQAYGDLSARHYVDLDVLVKDADLEQAVKLLCSQGYTPITNIGWVKKTNRRLSDQKDIYFRSEDGLVNVELHWRLSGSHFAMPFEMNGLWARLETVTLADVTVRTLPFDDLLIYLCLHGSRHGWERLGWICDVNELIRSRGEIDWERVIQKARELGCENVLHLGLYLVNDLFKHEFDFKAWPKVKKDLMLITCAKLIRAQLFTEQQTVMAIGDRYAYHLKLKEDRLDRWRLHFHYLVRYLRIIFKPRAIDTTVFNLPRVLEPLYYLMRPIRLFYNYALKSNRRRVQ